MRKILWTCKFFRGRRVPLSGEKYKYVYFFSFFRYARIAKKECERGFCVTLESCTSKNPVGGVKLYDLVAMVKFDVSKEINEVDAMLQAMTFEEMCNLDQLLRENEVDRWTME